MVFWDLLDVGPHLVLGLLLRYMIERQGLIFYQLCRHFFFFPFLFSIFVDITREQKINNNNNKKITWLLYVKGVLD
jgi:ABC-type sugar transport system permease subunit